MLEDCRLAMEATKGGRHLRLIDVARGRKIVSRLDFYDITAIKVCLDDVPITDMTVIQKMAAQHDRKHDLNVEFWSDYYTESESSKPYARRVRWTMMKEDRLKITTSSGSLYFRFYSDLAHFEAEKSEVAQNQVNTTIVKDIAFQWAETLSRICGREQLQQDLPHFGENNEDELRDYIEVTNFHERENYLRGKFFHRRRESKDTRNDGKNEKKITKHRSLFSLGGTKNEINFSELNITETSPV